MRKLFAIGAGLLTSLLALEARADDTSLEGLLAEEVVTSVSKSAESSQDAPALTRSISAEEIRRYGMTSVSEALDFLGVGVHAVSSLGRAELSVRGANFTGDRTNHLLVLLDGLPLNNALVGDVAIDQRMGVPLEMIDHIELVLGPGSAVYGTNALMGVVNVVTKSAKTLAGFHAVAEAGSIGTLRTTLTAGHSFELLGKRAEITAGITHYRQSSSIDFDKQDLGVDAVTGKRVIWGGTAHDSYRASVTGLRLRIVRDGLEISGRAVTNDLGDPTGISDFDHPQSGNIEARGGLAITQRLPIGRVGDLAATIYGRGYQNARRNLVSLSAGCPFAAKTCDYRDFESSSRVGAELQTNFDWLQNGRVLTSLGASTSLDDVRVRNMAGDFERSVLARPMLEALDDSTVVNVAANGQQTVKPLSWLDLTAGGRIDWRKIAGEDGNRHTFTPVVTPRLALAVRPWSGATAKLVYAEAFRAPNPYEADGRSPTLIASNDLQPETSHNREAIFEQRVDAHRFMVGLFLTHYHGVINRTLLTVAEHQAAYEAGLTPVVPSASSPVYQFKTEDVLRTHGFNAGVDGVLLGQRLHYGASFTGAVARVDRNELVAAAPQVFGNARLAYDLGGKLPTAALATTFAGTTASDHGADQGYRVITMAPPSLEVRATLTGRVPWVKGLTYRAIVSRTQNPTTAFSVGPTLRATTGFERTALAPTERWNAIVGLQYDLGD